MNMHYLWIVIAAIVCNILVYYYHKTSVITLCDVDKCPYCYGTDLCYKIFVETTSLSAFIDNFFNTKNVFHGKYENKSVVLKKLGHDSELYEFDQLVRDEPKGVDNTDYKIKVFKFLSAPRHHDINQRFKICSPSAGQHFFKWLIDHKRGSISDAVFYQNVWTILRINVEPLILQLLNEDINWPVPKYYGACGRVVVVENAGTALYNYLDSHWLNRAFLALQLLQAAKKFTESHPTFRFYLTDVSYDNVAVDSNLTVTFVDLEDVILTTIKNDQKTIHHSEHFEDEPEFAFSDESVCQSSISDHNFYAVCRVFLAPKGMWPVERGLLHSPPDFVLQSFPKLFYYVDECVTAKEVNRFRASEVLIQMLEHISHVYKK